MILSGQFTVRKNIENLTEKELADLRKAFSKIMELNPADDRGYIKLASYHGPTAQFCHHEPERIDGWPGVRLFLPWHRAYLYQFEKALQDQVPGVTIPYWDWRSATKIPKALSDKTADGKPNPLYQTRIFLPDLNIDRQTRRFPGSGGFPLPTFEDVDGLLRIKDDAEHFDDFSDELSNLHGWVHGWVGGMGIENGREVGGDMGMIPTAAFDPIFWLHHTFVDKIWWQWQKNDGVDEIPDHYKPMALDPFRLTVGEVLDIYNLGYDYAEATITVNGNWEGGQEVG